MVLETSSEASGYESVNNRNDIMNSTDPLMFNELEIDFEVVNVYSENILENNKVMSECINIVEDQDDESDKRVDYMTYACRYGHLGIVKGLLKSDSLFDVNSRDGSKNTGLHYAAENGHVEIVKKLLENGALPDLATEYGKTALEFAARNGHFEIVKELLKAGARAFKVIDVEDEAYQFPVFENLPSILSENHIEIVIEILKSHPYPLHQAIYHLSIHSIKEINIIINRLLESGISHDLQDRIGRTALHVSVIDEDEVSFQAFVELLKQGVNLEIKDLDNETPLTSAFLDNKVKCVTELLKYGANPNHHISNIVSETLLHSACRQGNITMLKILLEHGANINSLDNDNQTPLHTAILEVSDHCELIVKELLKNGADVNHKDNENKTAIHHAASEEAISEDLLQDMLNLCTNPNIKSFDEGKTPLHMASDEGFDSNVKNLLKYGADPNIRDLNGYDSFETSLIAEYESTFKTMIYNN